MRANRCLLVSAALAFLCGSSTVLAQTRDTSTATGTVQRSQADSTLMPPPIRSDDEAGAVLIRALDAEDNSRFSAAAAAYRQVIDYTLSTPTPDGNTLAMSLLGFERVMSEQGLLDSVVPVARRVIARRPNDPTAHTVHLRTLTSLLRDEEARTAFVLWRRAVPGDASPFREYARLLMQHGRNLAADSVLNEAVLLMGGRSALTGELAQLNISLERWVEAARAYAEALGDQPWLETAALYGLQRAPHAKRDSIRAVLTETAAMLPSRRLLSSLELGWGEPRRAWNSIASLPNDDSTTAAWKAFAAEVENGGAWSVARDARIALFERLHDTESQNNAASAALHAGDAEGALRLARTPQRDRNHALSLMATEIAALGELGRMEDAQQVLDRAGDTLPQAARASLVRPMVMGWLRVGSIASARKAIAGTDLEDDDELTGWLALYEGDLRTARKRLVRAASARPELTDALGLLARLREDTSTTLGAAFLAIARRDSSGAMKLFLGMSESAGAAAPALLAQAARYAPNAKARSLREQIVRDYASSPEAPEALLALARAAMDSGNRAGAIALLEQLLVNYQESALAPQARRELDQIKGQIPPGT